MINPKQQNQHRRVSALLRRAVGNQRFLPLSVGLFLLVILFVVLQYGNAHPQDQNFLYRIFNLIGLGHIGSQGLYFMPGARVGRGWFSCFSDRILTLLTLIDSLNAMQMNMVCRSV